MSDFARVRGYRFVRLNPLGGAPVAVQSVPERVLSLEKSEWRAGVQEPPVVPVPTRGVNAARSPRMTGGRRFAANHRGNDTYPKEGST